MAEGSLYLVVTEADLADERGMLCEACDRPMQVGDEYVLAIIGFSSDTPREFEAMMTPEQREAVEDWDAPIPILSDLRCRACFDADRPVPQEEDD